MNSRLLFKRPLSVSPSLNQRKRDKPQRQAKNSSGFNVCQVCGDKANIFNYGGLSCPSCKTFFRRNGFRPKNFPSCLFSKSCVINMNTRRYCIACRFAKCLSVGMNPYLIRKEVKQNEICSRSSKYDITEPIACKQVMSLLPLPTLDLLYDDRCSLIGSEWKLVSNVVHAHDVFSAIPQVCRIIEDLFTSPLNPYFNVTNAIETIIHIYTSFTSFVNSTPDFRILTVTERCSLFQRNLHGVVGLYSVLVFRESGIINNPNCMETFVTIYGLELMLQAKRMNKQLDPDSTIVKLMLIVLAFSSNCFIVDIHENMHNDSLLYGTYRLEGSQNVYLELLWKYMVYHYGYHNSVLRFSRLIELFLDLIKYSTTAYRKNTMYHHLVNDIIRQTKQSLIINQNKQVPLWGKT